MRLRSSSLLALLSLLVLMLVWFVPVLAQEPAAKPPTPEELKRELESTAED
jgi:hypothetical protein